MNCKASLPTGGRAERAAVSAVVAVAAVLATMCPLGGQDPPDLADPEGVLEVDGIRTRPSDPGDPGWWRGLRGTAEPNRIYLGIWALHLKRPEDGLSQHHLIGASWRGLYAATFMNTHERRTWSAGVGRAVVAVEGGEGSFMLGYRAGLLAGYDHRLMEIAERWPAIPAGQVTADVRYRRFGMQAGWSWIVVTFGGFVSL